MYSYLFGLGLLVFFVSTAASTEIVGGRVPWQDETWYVAQVLHRGLHFCGGTVISRRHILTAAHCVWEFRGTLFEDLDVVVVTNSIHSNGTGGTFHPIQEIVLHENYMTERTLQDDIAIIVLKDTPATKSLRSVDLPVRNVPHGSFGTFMGWGSVSHVLPPQKTLNKAVLKMVDWEHCYAEAPSDYLFPKQFCARAPKGYGTCSGDSGGSLVFQNVIYGSLSSGSPGIRECGTGAYDYFTNVYEYIDFIDRIIKQTFGFRKP